MRYVAYPTLQCLRDVQDFGMTEEISRLQAKVHRDQSITNWDEFSSQYVKKSLGDKRLIGEKRAINDRLVISLLRVFSRGGALYKIFYGGSRKNPRKGSFNPNAANVVLPGNGEIQLFLLTLDAALNGAPRRPVLAKHARSRTLPKVSSLTDVVREIKEQPEGDSVEGFDKAIREGNLVEAFSGLIFKGITIDYLLDEVKKYGTTLTVEDFVSRHGVEWGFDEAAIFAACARTTHLDLAAGFTRYL
jgi:hypothetical protein